MSRLQKKCFVGAISMHGLLLLTLIVGPAFFTKPKSADDAPMIEIIAIPTDGATQGGAPRPAPVQQETPQPPPSAPKVETPQPTPPTPQVQERKPEPKPEPDPPKITRHEPDAAPVERSKPKTHEVNVSRKTVKIPSRNTSHESSADSRTRSSEKSAFETALSNSRSRIRSNLSPTTRVDLPEGNGDGGVSYSNYGQIVRKIYTDAWRVPDDMTDDEATIKVSVTIARNGKVLSSRVVQSSGSAAADRSIQSTLDRINDIGVSFPAGAKESQRTFILTFNLKAKNAFG